MSREKLIYIASPYAGDIEANTAFAKKACRYAAVSLKIPEKEWKPELIWESGWLRPKNKRKNQRKSLGLLEIGRAPRLF